MYYQTPPHFAIKNNIQQGADPIHVRVKDNLPTRGINYSGRAPVFVDIQPLSYGFHRQDSSG